MKPRSETDILPQFCCQRNREIQDKEEDVEEPIESRNGMNLQELRKDRVWIGSRK
jgi:hypothetical protein